jgi:uncharacterized protein
MIRHSVTAAAIIAGTTVVGCAGAGAGALLHPTRHRVLQPPPPACKNATFIGAGVQLEGWRCAAAAPRLGTIVYLHGIADNRASAAGVIQRFLPRGFDVIAYDSRAHGESQGDACTYGFFEKSDLHNVLDTVEGGPIVLVGTSLGAAVALQEAADDRRVSGVVAAETFSDLRTIATERAPFFFSAGTISAAFRRAGEEGHFNVDAVSPRTAAATITAPVLLIHGAADVETRPEHSQRVFDALKGPKRLIMVPGASHNGSLRGEAWNEIERWIDQVVTPQTRPSV